ncbi:hypothetical protein [Dactylosporangium fulvum]|uniref:Type II toxin-antitoxin system RelE/ParE family toxin n=1 Tax=Dactylosporangium fulvum TaxID=53359 RepID=A0ABY5W166_9ACTN|nr:hypothetical protein [Dactylosporangium fulvum]UWP83014.1 hypothetical protein Dfulv_01520 [Dactylosporangium fulvum]
MIFGTNDAAKGWSDLCVQAPGPTRTAYLAMRDNPTPAPTERHHRLKGSLANGGYSGSKWLLPQWQIEVTGGGRIWYLVDDAAHKVIVMYAGTRHPKQTD